MKSSIPACAFSLLLVTASGRSVAAPADEADEAHDRGARVPSPAGTDDEHFRLGAIGGVGFPRPLSVAGIMKLERAFAIGIEYSYLPPSTIAGLDIRYQAVAADFRLFPLQSSFYFGLRAGRQHLALGTTVRMPSHGSVTSAVSTETFFLNPRLGLLYTSGAGFSIGIEAGVQLPLNHASTSTVPSGLPIPESIARWTSALGTSVLPTLTLLQLGLLL